jgi:hypothetical protein
MAIRSLILALLPWWLGVAAAEPPPFLLDRCRGDPCTWQQDAAGAWQGSGSTAGETWRQDAAGAWQGPGATAAGATWRQDAAGAWQGSGAAAGQTWRRDADGVWHGR